MDIEADAKLGRDGVPSPSAATVDGGTPTLPECRGFATTSIGRRGFLGGIVAAVAATANSMPSAPEGKPALRIAHVGDPQFGFITGRPSMKHRAKERFEENYRDDLARLERALARVNELKPDLLVFGGDMTQRPGDIEKEWPALLKRVQVPFVATPGNHDMGNRLTRENLERFRKVFGRDYGTFDVKGWRVVAGNSQYWYKTEAKDEQANVRVRREGLLRQLPARRTRGAARGVRGVRRALLPHGAPPPPFRAGLQGVDDARR